MKLKLKNKTANHFSSDIYLNVLDEKFSRMGIFCALKGLYAE
jgi:hypothetical protein